MAPTLSHQWQDVAGERCHQADGPTGAGLHVAAYVIEGDAVIGVTGAVISVAVPAMIFVLAEPAGTSPAVAFPGRVSRFRLSQG